MSEEKKLTAKEFRQAAGELYAKCHYMGGETIKTCVNALYYAADALERCEELMKQCVGICGKPECDHRGDKCIQCARPVINFIVTGESCEK